MTSVLSRLSEPSATSLMCSGRLSSTVQARSPRGIQVEPELRGNHDLLTERRQGFAHEFFVCERAVHLGGIEECHTLFYRGSQKRDHLPPVSSRTVRHAHSHAAEAKGRNFEAALSEFALFHSFSSEASLRGPVRR